MRLAIVTDAWRPQINGVVTVLMGLRERLSEGGHEVALVEPSTFNRVRCPGYPEVELSWRPATQVARRLDALRPDAIHLATEGPLGWAARRFCLRNGLPFTTAFHSRFPDFLAAATGLPPGLGYAILRRFHAPSSGVLVPSAGTLAMLQARGFDRLKTWSHGIDTVRFRAGPAMDMGMPRPVFLAVGRLSAEKNLDEFLKLDLPGSKLVVGGGPLLARLRERYPEVRFLGPVEREALPQIYAAADVLVHPSRTDTFGLVMLEALACGTPVAAFPVAGPLDVVGASGGGVLDADLRRAALAALQIPRERARQRALAFDADQVRDSFVANLALIARSAAEPLACSSATTVPGTAA
jgi:glycosyltransferase involved in cell wall biosynthesis